MGKTRLVDEIGQFTTIPNSVIDMWADIGPDAMSIFLYLRFRTNRETGKAFPSYARMQKDTGIPRQRISAALKCLNEAGLIIKERRFGESTLYTLKMPAIETEEETATSSSTSELSVVRQVHTNQTDINKKKEAKTHDKKRRAKRPPDPVFTALTEAAGYDIKSLTKSTRGMLNKFAKELREVNATPELIARFPAWYKAHIIDDKPSVAGFSKYWPRYLKSVSPPEIVPVSSEDTKLVPVELVPEKGAGRNGLYDNWRPSQENGKVSHNGGQAMSDAVADLEARANQTGGPHEGTTQ